MLAVLAKAAGASASASSVTAAQVRARRHRGDRGIGFHRDQVRPQRVIFSPICRVHGVPRLIDVQHLGIDRVIGSWLVDGVLVDPGPESCVHALLEGLGDEVPRGLLLTHIHFDHAGATGRLLERWPELPVYVHERGARHMADPEKLVASARQIWGDDFDRLWGQVVPVPEANLRVLSGGETVEGFDVEYVPGHAKHHVAYFHKD